MARYCEYGDHPSTSKLFFSSKLSEQAHQPLGKDSATIPVLWISGTEPTTVMTSK